MRASGSAEFHKVPVLTAQVSAQTDQCRQLELQQQLRANGQSAYIYAEDFFSFIICRAYSKRVFRTNCALRIKKCAPRISSGIYFLSTS